MTDKNEEAKQRAIELEKKLNREPRTAEPVPIKDDRKGSIQ